MESTAAKKTFQSSMERPNDIERMKDRSEAVALNKEIAQHASRKQLTEAMTLFEKAASLGWANSHTYAAAINANIRCGSVSGAASLFERLRKTRGLKIDVITCTTMMKGFCSEGDIARSVQLFEEMEKCRPPLLPNIRTINTFLRGCVITGDIENADKMIVKTQKDYLLAPDVSTWEYLVTLLCQGLMLDKAAPIVGRLQNDTTMSADLGGMHVVIAKVASLSGAWKTCRKAIEHAKAAIDLNERQDDLEDSNALQSYNDKSKSSAGKSTVGEVESSESFIKSEKEATGGKRAWKTPGTEEGGDSRAQSLDVFRKHKREELRQELIIVDTFMKKMILLNEKRVNERERAKKISAKKEWLSSGGVVAGAGAGKDGKKLEGGGGVEVDGEKKIAAAAVDAGEVVEMEIATVPAANAVCGMADETKGSKKRKNKGGGGAGGAADGACAGPADDSKLLYLLPYYSRLFSFAMPQNHVKKAIIVNTDPSTVNVENLIIPETDPKKLIVQELSQALLTKFGLNVCLEKLDLGPNAEAEEYAAKRLKIEEAASNEKKLTERVKSGSKDKNLTKKEKRKEKNQEMKIKKKKFALLQEEKKNEVKEITPNEMKFKSMLATNVMSDGFINFDKVFEKKAFLTSDVASQGDNSAIEKLEVEILVEGLEVKPRVRKLEICSGAGEWAISQAAADPLSDWMTMELRHDRVYQTFTRAIFAGLDNVCVMGGDATQILPQRILSDSLDFVFINHPEPPQQTGGFDSQGKHLLTLDFFGELARIVKPSGVVTIVTDNLWYGKYLMRLLASQGHPEFLSSITPKDLKERIKMTEKKGEFSSPILVEIPAVVVPKDGKGGKKDKSGKDKKTEEVKGKEKGKGTEKGAGKGAEKGTEGQRGVGAPGEWSVLEEEGGYSLYQGKPGCECGVVVDASSYFDRLWKIDQKVERYFLVLKKGPTPYSSEIHGNGLKFVTEKSKVRQELRINTSSNLEERAKKGGYAEKSLKAAAFLQAGGSNKKIKFED